MSFNNNTYGGGLWFDNNTWTTATTSTIQVWPAPAPAPAAVEASDDRLLTDMEWLDAEVEEVCELAFAA